MPSPTIDFRTIRPHHGSQHSGFEEAICQLAALETAPDAPFHRKGAGADAGLECYRVEADGSETGWQAKYFFEFGSSEASQLTESLSQAIARHPQLGRFIVGLPFNLSDGRVGNRISERDRWNRWVQARADAILPRVVTIELWDETQLIERFSRNEPQYAGRRHYWFDLLHFTPDWFQTRFAITRKALGTRYTPELNIELPIRRGLLAIARDPAFIESLTRLADELDEARHRTTDSVARILASGPAATQAADLDVRFRAISSLIRTASISPADPVPFDPWVRALDEASETLGVCSAAIWDLRTQQGGDRDEVRRVQFFVEHLYEAIEKVSGIIKRPVSRLANEHRLLVTGEAGTVKRRSKGTPDRRRRGTPFSDNRGRLREGAESYAKDLGQRYSPVRLMCSHPNGETWASRSGAIWVPLAARVLTTSPSFMVFQNMMMAASRFIPAMR